MSETAILVENVSKVYRRYNRPVDRLKELLLPGKSYAQEFWALKDINLKVYKGQTVGIIGRNGCGKSTLLQIIAGTLTPSSGKVEVNGRIGALLELGSGFNFEFTGRENVFLNGSILGLTREEMESKFDDIAAFADIGDFIDQPVKTYSSGMIVRLAFAVSVNIEPEILIIDEALAVGDAAFQFKCFERLKELTSSGVTVLFVSHEMSSVKTFCENVLYLDKGMERGAGSAEDITELYLMDLRDQQKKMIDNKAKFGIKQSVGNNNKLAFGSDEGKIIKAEFLDNNSHHSIYIDGDLININIEVEFSNKILNPTLSIMIQDRKMLPLGGKYYTLSKTKNNQNFSNQSIQFSFVNSLTEGYYFITIKLEDRQLENQVLPIDKQVGVLSFEVMRSGAKKFLGMVDLKINCYEVETNKKEEKILSES